VKQEAGMEEDPVRDDQPDGKPAAAGNATLQDDEDMDHS
jgi:hypothetical protein